MLELLDQYSRTDLLICFILLFSILSFFYFLVNSLTLCTNPSIEQFVLFILFLIYRVLLNSVILFLIAFDSFTGAISCLSEVV